MVQVAALTPFSFDSEDTHTGSNPSVPRKFECVFPEEGDFRYQFRTRGFFFRAPLGDG